MIQFGFQHNGKTYLTVSDISKITGILRITIYKRAEQHPDEWGFEFIAKKPVLSLDNFNRIWKKDAKKN